MRRNLSPAYSDSLPPRTRATFDRHSLDLPSLMPEAAAALAVGSDRDTRPLSEAARAALEAYTALAGLRTAQLHELSKRRDIYDLPLGALEAATAIIAGEPIDPDTRARVMEGIESLHMRLRWQRMLAFCRNRHDAAAT